MAKVKVFTYQVKGVNKIVKNIEKLPAEMLDKVLWPAVTEAAQIGADIAKDIAILEVDDITTKNYIPGNIGIARRVKRGREEKAAIVSVGVFKRRSQTDGGGQTFYWWFLELGTSRNKAKPFLRPAFINNGDKIFKTALSVARYEMSKLRLDK